jgi:hypothetical protein
MAKKQTRRSISVSKTTYERLRAYCETNGISMSQFVEMRVGDYLGRSTSAFTAAVAPAPTPAPAPQVPQVAAPQPRPAAPAPAPRAPERDREPVAQSRKLSPDQIFTF